MSENKNQKFFKIVNPSGNHGVKYIEGLNVERTPFSPDFDFEIGGISFAGKDIFHFLCYGSEVYEVEPIGDVYENPCKTRQEFKAHSVTLKYIGRWVDISVLKYMVESGANIGERHSGWCVNESYVYASHWLWRSGNLDSEAYLNELAGPKY